MILIKIKNDRDSIIRMQRANWNPDFVDFLAYEDPVFSYVDKDNYRIYSCVGYSDYFRVGEKIGLTGDLFQELKYPAKVKILMKDLV